MGRFREQVERYLSRFPAEQVRVIRFRDWTADPRATYSEILDFLGLEDDGRTDFPPINEGKTYRARSLARLIMRPPMFVRRAARVLKKLPFGTHLYRAARTLGLRSAPGYRSEVSPELRDQIKRYYAKDNQQLEEQLRRQKSPATVEPE
jgi:hypothetical protein